MAEEGPKISIDGAGTALSAGQGEEADQKVEKPKVEAVDEHSESEMSLFDYLVSTLAAQTMIALGLVAEDGQEKVVVDLGTANHLIDSLIMLHDKTRGNLTKYEEKHRNQAAAALQRGFT